MNSLKTYDSLGQTYYLAGPDVMTVAEQVRGCWGAGLPCASRAMPSSYPRPTALTTSSPPLPSAHNTQLPSSIHAG